MTDHSKRSGRLIDLRSDTVTRPTPEMRAAMATADVGDDVYGEDPTVNELETKAAQAFGKEAALFCPTGTMANTVAIKAHTRHGEEVICDARAHVMDWELSMMAWFAGCLARTVPTEDGILHWPAIHQRLRPNSPHNAPTTLVCLENTHNLAGGTVYAQDDIDEICIETHRRGLKVHIDGARIFNAAAATNTSVAAIARHADSVMFCLSKGLGAPVGSMLVGTENDIAQARLYRKRLGGGMRQAGVLAAAGLIALHHGPSRLHEDHANAQVLARALAGIPGIAINPTAVATNIVIFDIAQTGMTAVDFSLGLKSAGILANAVGPVSIRMVTHLDVSRNDCLRAIEAVTQILEVHRTSAGHYRLEAAI